MLETYIDNYKLNLDRAYEIYLEYFMMNMVDMNGRPVPLFEDEIDEIKRRALARKSQAFGVATKRLKIDVLIHHLDIIKENIDLTPTLANKFAFKILGRGIRDKTLMLRYSTPGRDASKKSQWFDPKLFEEMTRSEEFNNCLQMMEEAMSNMAEAKVEVAKSRHAQLINRRVKNMIEMSVEAAGE